jgi:hypothetical protein
MCSSEGDKRVQQVGDDDKQFVLEEEVGVTAYSYCQRLLFSLPTVSQNRHY